MFSFVIKRIHICEMLPIEPLITSYFEEKRSVGESTYVTGLGRLQ